MAVSTWKWKRVETCGTLHPQPRHGHRAVTFKDHMVIYGGGNEGVLGDLLVFNTVNRQWSSPTVKGEVPPALASCGLVCIGSRLVLFGGVTASGKCSNDLYELIVKTWEWRKLKYRPGRGLQTPCPRLGHSFTIWSNKVVLFGGVIMYPAGAQETHRYLNDVFVLDLWPTSGLNGFPVWDYPVCAGTVPPPRESHAAVVCQVGDASTLIIHGGSNGNRLGDLWMLNLDRMQWSCPSTTGDRPLPRSLHSACCLNGQFVVFGGWVDSDSGGAVNEDFLNEGPCECTNCFACLDIDTMTWRSFCAAGDVMEMAPRPRSGHSCVIIGSRMYIFSGRIGCKWLCSRPAFAKDLWFLETEVPRPPACVYLVRSSPQALEISWTNLLNADAYIVQVQKYDMPPGVPGTAVMMNPSMMTEGQSTSCSTTTTAATTMGTAKSFAGAGALLAQAASTALGTPREGIVSIRPDLQPRIGRTATRFAEAAVMPTEVRLACVPAGITVRPSVHVAQNLSLPAIRAVLAGGVTTGMSVSGTTVPPVGSLVRLVGPATQVIRLPHGAALAPVPGKGLVTASGSGRVTGIPQQPQVITLVRAAQPTTSLGPGSAMVVSGVPPSAGMVRSSAPLLPTVFALPQPRLQSTSHIGTTVVTSCGQQGMLLSSVGAAPLMAAGNQFIFAGSAAVAGGQHGVLLSPICSTQVVHSAGQHMIITSSSGTMPAAASGIVTVVHQPAGVQQRSLAQASGAGPVMFLGSHGTPTLLSIPSSLPPGVSTAVAVSSASMTPGATLPFGGTTKSEAAVVCQLNSANNDRHRMTAEVKSEPIDDIVLTSAPSSEEPSDNLQVSTSGVHGSGGWCVAGIVKSTTMTISRYYPVADVNDGDSPEDIDVLGDDDECGISLDGLSMEPGVAYKIRVAGINSCGRGQWSGIVAFRTSLPGLPGAPASVKITKTPDGALLSWDPPPITDDDSTTVTEYAAFLAVNKSGPPKPNVQSPQMAFVRVYCGPSHHCTVLNSSLQSAFVDSSQPKNAAVIFRISARNHKGYGPAAHVRWLVGQDLISSLRTPSNALIKPASNRLLQPSQGATATHSTGLVPLPTTSSVSFSTSVSGSLPSMASLAKAVSAQTSNVSLSSTMGLVPLPTMASLAKTASAQTSLSTDLLSSRLLSLPQGVPSVVQRTMQLASAAIPATSASLSPAPDPGDCLISAASVVTDDTATAPATKRRKPDNV